MSYRVLLLRGDVEVQGWALNLSRSGLRAMVEDHVLLGEELEVRIEEIEVTRRGRVVWTQEEPDGTILGISFFERLEDPPSGVELDSSLEIAPGDLARQLGMTEAELRAALDDTEPGRGEPIPAARAEPSRAEPSRAEPSKEPDPGEGGAK